MSETTNLKLLKHDNVETNTDKFDIENYLNGNWDKIDENVGEVNTNISNIKKEQETQNTNIEENNSKIVELQTEKAKLETELKEMQEDFYQNSIRGQVSGEYIHVEDSSNCRAKIGIGGNSEQETSTQTENYVDDREARGKTISQATSLYLPIINLKAGDNYYFKIFDKDNQLLQNSMYLAVEFYDVNKTKIQDGPLGFPKSFTEEAVTKIKYAKIYYNGNDTDKAIGNTVIKKIGLKITSNASADDIDLFVPNMPSPDYPSEIKTVGSNVNLANLGEKAQYTSSGFTVSWKDSVFKMSGTASTNLTIPAIVTGVTNAINLGNFKAGTYTVSRKILNGNVINAKGSGIYLRSSNGMIASIYIASIKDRASFTLTEDTNIYIYAFIDSGTQYSDLEIGIKIAEGTEVGEYSKYGQGSVKVTKCNKNLFDKNADNLPALSGEYGLALSNFINESLLGKTVTLSFNTTMYFIEFASRESSGLVLFKYNSNYLTFEVTQELLDLKDERYLFIQQEKGVWISRKDTQLTYDIQLEEGTTATPYEEHQEQSYIMPTQQPMRSIGDIRDTFIKKENKWYERHYVQRLILNGTEGWNYDKNNNRFYFAKAGNKGSGYIMSSHYLRGDTTKQNNTCEIWSSAILFRDERFTEREDFKNMIKAKYDEGIPVYVDYVLAEPLDIECTEEQSKILDELENARTYKNVTNIYSTDEISPIIDLDYAKDLETLLNNTQALAVNNASEGV